MHDEMEAARAALEFGELPGADEKGVNPGVLQREDHVRAAAADAARVEPYRAVTRRRNRRLGYDRRRTPRAHAHRRPPLRDAVPATAIDGALSCSKPAIA